MKSKILGLFIFLLAFSCSDDNGTETSPAIETYNTVEKSNSIEEAINASIDLYLIKTGVMLRGGPSTFISTLDLPECTTVTSNITQNGLKVTLNFGTGCNDQFGNTHAGIVHILVALSGTNITYTKTFENYTFNGNSIVGTIVGMRNAVNNDISVNRTANLTITTAEGKIIKRTSNHTIKLMEGASTPTEEDNIFSITGGSTNVIDNGTTWTVKIEEPVIRKASCTYQAVKGILSISNGISKLAVDYGNGECDGVAKVTLPNGNVITVNL